MAKIDKNSFAQIAQELAKNMEDESEAIKSYQELLTHINAMKDWKDLYQRWNEEKNAWEDKPTAAADKKMFEVIAKNIKEYVAEELKHLKGLQIMYEAITGLKAES